MPSDAVIFFRDVPIYQIDNLVFSDASLELGQGEFAYLIGKTGSGKSSLLKAMYAELPVKQGQAMVAGYDLIHIRKREIPYLRRKLGIIFQDFQLLSDRNVEENLLFVLKATGWRNRKQMEGRIGDVLGKVGLATKGFKMPHQLSGGEQQRLAIARALLNDPEIILADEPTGNLDPETSREIMRLLFDISHSGRAVLMATHNYLLINEFSARIIRCEGGKIHSL
ncbi:MAG: ATP-binding cassette domain-containing protein [Bacteroidales bacterium]|nr:ATP-binding cassette domain-containing protein [Bacteroidales bacterium]